jgi:peroxiredoxin
MKMRKNIVFCLILILALTACNKDRVVISGRIANAEKQVLHLGEVDVYDVIPVDSVVLGKNGKFSFSIDTKVPCFYQLSLSSDKIIVLFPSPGEHIKIDADAGKLLTSLKTEGSYNTEQATRLIRMLNETKIRLDSVGALYNKASSDSLKNQLNKKYMDILEKHRKASIAYILTNYKSLSVLYALYQQYKPGYYVFYKTTDMQFYKIVSDSLSKYLPDSKHVTAFKAHTDKIIGDYQAQLILRSAGQIGVSLPAIALPNVAGDMATLKSLTGKYVLLSFWASSDRACVSQNLELKKVYSKYKKQGFEIFQVSFDNSPESWKKSVNYDELPWISVIDATYPNSVVAGNYNVNQLPANYLIGKDNTTILAKNLTPAQLREKLNDLLNQ